MSLEEKIIDVFKRERRWTMTLWSVTNGVYDGCMGKPNKSNGARVSGIIKAANKSDYLERCGDQIVMLNDDY